VAFCLTRNKEVFALLNEAQVAAVRDYLLFIEEEPDYEFDREDIRRALEESWVK
jgi:sarcosine oxidase delta subunit